MILGLGMFCVSGFAKTYKGAELRTKDAYVYGRFEVRYLPPAGDGYLASFFTYHEITGQTAWNEIDFEILGRYDNDVQVTSIGPGQKIRNGHQFVTFNPMNDYHAYAFEWTPDYIAWFIDSVEVYRQTGSHIPQFQYPQKIMMNIWPPEYKTWVGNLDDRILPLFAYYDWVRYSVYTPGSGNSGTDNNFTLLWKDEFDAFDDTRWEKATHTWGGNNSDFMTENCVFKDGQMILCLTKEGAQLGYVDRTPPAMLWARVENNKISGYYSEPVQKTSAEKTGNYIISGVTISKAELQNDNRTVILSVSEMDPNSAYKMLILGIKDKASTPNMMAGQNLQLIMVKPLSFPLRVNVGGDTLGEFLGDQEWEPAVEFGHQDGYVSTYEDGLEIMNTDLDSIYHSELDEVVTYNVRAPDGLYRVKLMIAENSINTADTRVFNIHVEGREVAANLDMFSQFGLNTAHEIVADSIYVADGILNIHLTNLKNHSLLNGLVVESISTAIESGTDRPLPQSFRLFQNYPNPFNSTTSIVYDLPQAGRVNLEVYDILGKQVAVLVDKRQDIGRHQINWKANAASGLYFYKIRLEDGSAALSAIRKMIIIN
jgi:hypothetical protein